MHTPTSPGFSQQHRRQRRGPQALLHHLQQPAAGHQQPDRLALVGQAVRTSAMRSTPVTASTHAAAKVTQSCSPHANGRDRASRMTSAMRDCQSARLIADRSWQLARRPAPGIG